MAEVDIAARVSLDRLEVERTAVRGRRHPREIALHLAARRSRRRWRAGRRPASSRRPAAPRRRQRRRRSSVRASWQSRSWSSFLFEPLDAVAQLDRVGQRGKAASRDLQRELGLAEAQIRLDGGKVGRHERRVDRERRPPRAHGAAIVAAGRQRPSLAGTPVGRRRRRPPRRRAIRSPLRRTRAARTATCRSALAPRSRPAPMAPRSRPPPTCRHGPAPGPSGASGPARAARSRRRSDGRPRRRARPSDRNSTRSSRRRTPRGGIAGGDPARICTSRTSSAAVSLPLRTVARTTYSPGGIPSTGIATRAPRLAPAAPVLTGSRSALTRRDSALVVPNGSSSTSTRRFSSWAAVLAYASKTPEIDVGRIDGRTHRQPLNVGRSQDQVADLHARPAQRADLEAAVGAAEEAAGLAHDDAHHVDPGRQLHLRPVVADSRRRTLARFGRQVHRAAAALCEAAGLHAADGEQHIRRRVRRRP